MTGTDKKALCRAIEAHNGQCLLGTDNKPHVIHCINVAESVRVCSINPHVIAAAYLHDVLRYTKSDINDFNEQVIQLVKMFTNRIEDVLEDSEAVTIKMAEELDEISFGKKTDQDTTKLLQAAEKHSLTGTNVYINLVKRVSGN